MAHSQSLHKTGKIRRTSKASFIWKMTEICGCWDLLRLSEGAVCINLYVNHK